MALNQKMRSRKTFRLKEQLFDTGFPSRLFSTLFPSHHTPRATRQNL